MTRGVILVDPVDPVDPAGWFADALAAPVDTVAVEVDGIRINARCWGAPGPGIVLIHGGAAHARWWDHIAPLLAADYRVLAFDLSGHGDSGRRSSYSLEAWSDEAMAVAAAAGVVGRPVLIGHSMGGWVAITAGGRHGQDVAGVIVIDSPIRRPVPEDEAASQRTSFGPLRRYATKHEAVARFHTVPAQDGNLPYVQQHVAETSVCENDGAWTWKFDPLLFERNRRPALEVLGEVSCRVGVFRAEYGLVTPDIGAEMYDALGRVAPVIEIPLAGHHPMLDQPMSLVVGLRTMLADWEHSSPQLRDDESVGEGGAVHVG
jgi:pimeloyl-ACP methyl ester carboxylesterase